MKCFNVLGFTTLGLLLPLSGFAADQPAPTPAPNITVTGNIGLVSDYMFRGISLSNRRPAIQGEVDINQKDGWYLSLWSSSISEAAYHHTTGQEVDVYVGKKTDLPFGIQLDSAIDTYSFPNARLLSPTGDGKYVSYNTQELKLSFTKSIYNFTTWVGLNRDWSGFDIDKNFQKASTRGSTYLELNANPQLTENLQLNLHAGHEMVVNNAKANFFDGKIGVTLDGKAVNLPGWSGSIAAVRNTGKQSMWAFSFSDGTPGRNSTGNTAVLSLTRNF